MTRNRDYESRRRGCKRNFSADVNGGCNSIAPSAKSIQNNYYNYADSTAAVVEQELEKYYLGMLDEAQREIDECPRLDVLYLKYFLHRVMPSKYSDLIEQLRRRQPQGATYNVCIGGPDTNMSRAHSATFNDRYLPPQAVMGG